MPEAKLRSAVFSEDDDPDEYYSMKKKTHVNIPSHRHVACT